MGLVEKMKGAQNGKTAGSNAVDSTKIGSGGDTSGEENKKSCNGTPLGKKRKKAGRPPSAIKSAKLSTSKLNPVGITIPAVVREQEEEKIVDIPNLDSPLFKDVPSKKNDSSSDSSSTSGSSSSDDSSSEDDDSEDEESKKESAKNLKDDQEAEPASEASKPRTPIKLTISNVGKPSAKVTSSSSRDILESNSSDSDSDRGQNDEKKTNSTEKLAEHNQFPGTKTDPGSLKWKPSNVVSMTTEVNDLHSPPKQLNNSIKQLHENSQGIQPGRESQSFENCNESPVNKMNGPENKPENDGKETGHCEQIIPENKSYDEDSLLKEEGDMAVDTDMKNLDEDYLLKEDDNENKEVTKDPHVDSRITKDTENGDKDKSVDGQEDHEDSVQNVSDVKPALDDLSSPDGELAAAAVRTNTESKYCPDGFILAPTLSKSPEHLRSPLKLNSFYNNNVTNLDSLSENQADECMELEKEDESFGDTKNKVESESEDRDEKLKDKPSTETPDGKESINGPLEPNLSLSTSENGYSDQGSNDDTKRDVITTESSSSKEVLNNSVDKVISCSSPTATNPNNCALEQGNQEMKESSSLPTPLNPSTSSSAPSPHINSLSEISTTITKTNSTTSVTDALTSSLSISTSVTPMISPSLATTTTCSPKSSKMSSPISASVSGFTNGIPDKENPFITWTKYDDDVSGSVDSHLPSSSLVQALARAPFPPLALPSDNSMSQISPLGASLPQLSPLGMTGISPGSQLPRLASPGSQRMRMSPNQSCPSSSSVSQTTPTSRGPTPSTSEPTKAGNIKNKIPQKSVKRTSRLSNIIDNLRSSKEKQVIETQGVCKPPAPPDQAKKSTLDTLFSLGHGNVSPSLPSASPVIKTPTSNALPPSSIIPSSNKDAITSASEKTLRDSLGFQHQISADTRQAIRSSLDAARAQAVNDSFNALRDDLDKGKRILENLEIMKNGPLDPYGKSHVPEQKPRRVESSSQSVNRGRPSSLSSSSSIPVSTPMSSSSSSSSRPSSRQSSKPISNQGYSSSLASSSKSSSNSLSNSSMLQAAPSAALTAAHIELNAAAANIMAFQHMYGMQDPYVMKTLMNNPLYLQHMMEFQKQAMDPLMLRQLEILEAASAADKSKNSKDQRAAINAQNLLWSAQAMFQHQQLQQLQQLQLHHQQQQLQQQAAAAREKESFDTIAALMANKSNNFHNSSKSSGSISAGQSSKFAIPSSTSTSSSSASSNKRPRSNVPSTMSSVYSREGLSSSDKKPRLSSSQLTNASYSSTSSSGTPSSSARSSHAANKMFAAGTSGRQSVPSKQDYQDLQAHLSASAAAGLWGYSGVGPSQQMDVARMSRFFERPSETASSSSSSSTATAATEHESSGIEVLDLSVKPRNGK